MSPRTALCLLCVVAMAASINATAAPSANPTAAPTSTPTVAPTPAPTTELQHCLAMCDCTVFTKTQRTEFETMLGVMGIAMIFIVLGAMAALYHTQRHAMQVAMGFMAVAVALLIVREYYHHGAAKVDTLDSDEYHALRYSFMGIALLLLVLGAVLYPLAHQHHWGFRAVYHFLWQAMGLFTPFLLSALNLESGTVQIVGIVGAALVHVLLLLIFAIAEKAKGTDADGMGVPSRMGSQDAMGSHAMWARLVSVLLLVAFLIPVGIVEMSLPCSHA